MQGHGLAKLLLVISAILSTTDSSIVPQGGSLTATASAAVEKPVFAHYMLCFAAFGERGTSENATDGTCCHVIVPTQKHHDFF